MSARSIESEGSAEQRRRSVTHLTRMRARTRVGGSVLWGVADRGSPQPSRSRDANLSDVAMDGYEWEGGSEGARQGDGTRADELWPGIRDTGLKEI